MFIGILYLLYLIATIVTLLFIAAGINMHNSKTLMALFSLLFFVIITVLCYIPLILDIFVNRIVAIIYMIVLLLLEIFCSVLALDRNRTNNYRDDDHRDFYK